MNNPKPNITVKVDVTNPGQFFACCGLLELASRLDHHAEGWFSGEAFHISGAPADSIQQFLDAEITPIDDAKSSEDEDDGGSKDLAISKTTALWIAAPFNLRLNWWRDTDATTHAKLKTWSAGQKVTDLFVGVTTNRQTKRGPKTTYQPSMRDHFRDIFVANPDDWLRATVATDSPKPYCYDSRLSRKAALDGGHTNFGLLASSPAVDVLVHVAFQRFRPRMIELWTRNLYCTWHSPLGVSVASVAALGIIPQVIQHCFEFPIKPCDAAGRYKLFGHAQLVRSIP